MPIENLRAMVRCPVCDKKYRTAKILVLDESDKKTTLHLTCVNCGAASMLFVSLGQFGVVSLGLLTDLKHSEARTVLYGEMVSTDNVIEAHQFLKNYTGSIEALI